MIAGALAEHPALALGLICSLAAFALAFALRRKGRPPPRVAQRSQIAAIAALPIVSSADLVSEVHAAEASGANDKLPGLYLALAQSRISDGAAAEGEELLRKILRSAGQRSNESHAKARVLLGDMAKAKGDLSTACEHWQMARAMFYELNEKGEHASVETRMLKNGCPTDWVLTDF